MSFLPTLPDTPGVISSPESGSGAMPCAVPDGPIPALSGQAPAPAGLSARQAKEQGLLTSGISGPRSSISSASAVLSRSLANRLQAVTDVRGSTLYKLTWKEPVTPAGRSIPALPASVLRTSGRDYTGWRSPSASDPVGGVMEIRKGCAGKYKLRDEAHLAEPYRRTVSGEMLTGFTAATVSGGRLNPALSRRLMGLPPVWDDCAVTAMPLSPRRRKRS